MDHSLCVLDLEMLFSLSLISVFFPLLAVSDKERKEIIRFYGTVLCNATPVMASLSLTIFIQVV